jgi:hypothetical protein
LPFASGIALDWGNGNYYAGAQLPDIYLFGKPVWSDPSFSKKQTTPNDLSEYMKIIRNTNTRYVVLHKDIPEHYEFSGNIKGSPHGQTAYSKLNFEISKNPDFDLVEDNKFFKLFQIKMGLYSPDFYFQNKFNNVESGTIRQYKIDSTKPYPHWHTSAKLISVDTYDKG